MSRPSLFPHSTTGPKGPVFTRPESRLFDAGLLAALVGFGVFFDHTAAKTLPPPGAIAALHRGLSHEHASAEVRQLAQWVVESRDHDGLPFLVVDKARARLFAFGAFGGLVGSAPLLPDPARGNERAQPATPAGRFTTDTWRSALDDGIVWVQGDTAPELFAVRPAASPGRPLQRLASGLAGGSRRPDVSLQVPDAFYRQYLAPLRGQAGVAYVLPDRMPAADLFITAASDPRRHGAQSSSITPRRPS